MSEVHELVQRFVTARSDERWAVLEGYHPIKHALRFGAAPAEVVAAEDVADAQLPRELAAARVTIRRVAPEVFERLVPRHPPIAVVARAPRPDVDLARVLDRDGHAPLVFLERPTHLGNLGAAVRVVAAAGAQGLVTSGRHDPWNPAALRGSAGLHYAVPVGRIHDLPVTERPVVAFDAAGTPYDAADIAPHAVLAFGTERHGISAELRARADLVVRIPMMPKVSSLNLATSVAVALYAHPSWRAGGPTRAR